MFPHCLNGCHGRYSGASDVGSRSEWVPPLSRSRDLPNFSKICKTCCTASKKEMILGVQSSALRFSSPDHPSLEVCTSIGRNPTTFSKTSQALLVMRMRLERSEQLCAAPADDRVLRRPHKAHTQMVSNFSLVGRFNLGLNSAGESLLAYFLLIGGWLQ